MILKGVQLKNNEKVLEVNSISKTFKKHKNKEIKAVDSISFDINKGEIFGVLGPNGSGKSTLIRMISTLLIPDSGFIKIFGFDSVKEAGKVRYLINRVSVEASFFKKLSAMENLLFTAGLYGIKKRDAREKLMEIFEIIKLDKKRINDPLEDFSRGMQQKVAIARAFLTSPELLLLDEPTTGLDPRAKREVQELMEKVKSESNTTILLTTHDMEEADLLCSRVAIMHKGKIRIQGYSEDLKKSVSVSSKEPDLEDVFMFYTGSSLTEDTEELQEVS